MDALPSITFPDNSPFAIGVIADGLPSAGAGDLFSLLVAGFGTASSNVIAQDVAIEGAVPAGDQSDIDETTDAETLLISLFSVISSHAGSQTICCEQSAPSQLPQSSGTAERSVAQLLATVAGTSVDRPTLPALSDSTVTNSDVDSFVTFDGIDRVDLPVVATESDQANNTPQTFLPQEGDEANDGLLPELNDIKLPPTSTADDPLNAFVFATANQPFELPTEIPVAESRVFVASPNSHPSVAAPVFRAPEQLLNIAASTESAAGELPAANIVHLPVAADEITRQEITTAVFKAAPLQPTVNLNVTVADTASVAIEAQDTSDISAAKIFGQSVSPPGIQLTHSYEVGAVDSAEPVATAVLTAAIRPLLPAGEPTEPQPELLDPPVESETFVAAVNAFDLPNVPPVLTPPTNRSFDGIRLAVAGVTIPNQAPSSDEIEGEVEATESQINQTEHFTSTIADSISVFERLPGVPSERPFEFAPVRTLTSQVLTALVQRLATASSSDQNTITLRLDPPELGQLQVEFRHRETGVQVRIEAVDAVTMEMLVSRGSEIEKLLRSQDLNVSKVEFAQAETDTSAGGQRNSESQEQRRDEWSENQQLRQEAIRQRKGFRALSQASGAKTSQSTHRVRA